MRSPAAPFGGCRGLGRLLAIALAIRVVGALVGIAVNAAFPRRSALVR